MKEEPLRPCDHNVRRSRCTCKPGMLAQIFDPSTRGAEAGVWFPSLVHPLFPRDCLFLSFKQLVSLENMSQSATPFFLHIDLSVMATSKDASGGQRTAPAVMWGAVRWSTVNPPQPRMVISHRMNLISSTVCCKTLVHVITSHPHRVIQKG